MKVPSRRANTLCPTQKNPFWLTFVGVPECSQTDGGHEHECHQGADRDAFHRGDSSEGSLAGV